jgi:hypothetical protein
MLLTVEEKQLAGDSDAVVDGRFVKNAVAALTVVDEQGVLGGRSTPTEIRQQIEAVCLRLLKTEIASDPMVRGYAGKTAAQIATLLNEPYTKVVATPVMQPPRWQAVYPRAVTVVDVTFAKALVATPGDPAALSLAVLQDEINTDPAGRGYAGKTDRQVATLLNETYDASVPVESRHFPRVAAVLAGLPYVPNAVTEADVVAAQL